MTLSCSGHSELKSSGNGAVVGAPGKVTLYYAGLRGSTIRTWNLAFQCHWLSQTTHLMRPREAIHHQSHAILWLKCTFSESPCLRKIISAGIERIKRIGRHSQMIYSYEVWLCGATRIGFIPEGRRRLLLSQMWPPWA